MKKTLISSDIIFHGRRSSFLSNDVPLHRHFRLPLPYPFSDTTVYAKSGRNCVKGGEPPYGGSPPLLFFAPHQIS